MTLFLAGGIAAQDYSTEEIEMMQEVFGDEKRTIIQENVNLEGVDADKFWKLYDQYEDQRKDIGMEKMKLLKSYTTKQGNMTPLQALAELAEMQGLLLTGEQGGGGEMGRPAPASRRKKRTGKGRGRPEGAGLDHLVP